MMLCIGAVAPPLENLKQLLANKDISIFYVLEYFHSNSLWEESIIDVQQRPASIGT